MKIFTLLLALSICLHCQAQEKVVSGCLTSDEDGSPLPGVNVVIKGTSRGTTTDTNGCYSLEAPIGSILVFSFVGLATREVVVTKDGLSSTRVRVPSRTIAETPFERSWLGTQVSDTTRRYQKGVAVLSKKTGRLLNTSVIAPREILKLRKIGKNFYIHTTSPNYQSQANLTVQLTSSVGFETVNRFPELQRTFAQGRASGGSLQWRGADQGEVFSFGPMLKTLEFDGAAYAFDRDGKLTTRGTGNGNAARGYNSLDFFESIVNSDHQLTAVTKIRRNSTLLASYDRHDRNGIIPGSYSTINNLSLRLRNFPFTEKLNVSASSWYQLGGGRLLSHGSNISNIIYSVYRTPPSFDNSNGVGRWEKEDNRSWLLPDGTLRTYAPGAADNPYDLAMNLPDRDWQRRSVSSLQLRYDINDLFQFNSNLGYDHQTSETINGFLPGTTAAPGGRLTKRTSTSGNFSNITSMSFNYDHYDWDFTGLLAWHLNSSQVDLIRSDHYGFTRESFGTNASGDTRIDLTRHMQRTTTELVARASLSYVDALKLKLSNKTYLSNTLSTRWYPQFFPYASAETEILTLIEELSMEDLYLAYSSDIKPYVAYNRNLREGPLLWSDWSYGSTMSSASTAMTFFERSELFFNSALLPEIDSKFETGVSFSHNGLLNIHFHYYQNKTDNLIAPIFDGIEAELRNAASIRTRGLQLTASHLFHTGNYSRIQAAVSWHKYNTTVDDVYTSAGVVPLAGFSEVSSVLMEGQPLGAIYGTGYARDEAGNEVIGNDGFPVVDTTPRVIGNPIPKWTGGTNLTWSYKGLTVWTVFDYKYGGDRWNGTSRVLDYFGVSKNSAEQRTINNFVFEGNDISGKPNTIPVSFAAPEGATTANRWVRDGYVGAAEDYIQDASWLRMGELGIAWETNNTTLKFLKSFRVSLVARNLLLVTPYRGSDPSTALFGYVNGSGLDFFNSPNTKGLQLSVTAKL